LALFFEIITPLRAENAGHHQPKVLRFFAEALLLCFKESSLFGWNCKEQHEAFWDCYRKERVRAHRARSLDITMGACSKHIRAQPISPNAFPILLTPRITPPNKEFLWCREWMPILWEMPCQDG
jgi:hypothetical protein